MTSYPSLDELERERLAEVFFPPILLLRTLRSRCRTFFEMHASDRFKLIRIDFFWIIFVLAFICICRRVPSAFLGLRIYDPLDRICAYAPSVIAC